jgi:hypothetical protein
MVLVIWLNENVLHLQTGQDFRLIHAVMQATRNLVEEIDKQEEVKEQKANLDNELQLLKQAISNLHDSIQKVEKARKDGTDMVIAMKAAIAAHHTFEVVVHHFLAFALWVAFCLAVAMIVNFVILFIRLRSFTCTTRPRRAVIIYLYNGSGTETIHTKPIFNFRNRLEREVDLPRQNLAYILWADFQTLSHVVT